MHIGGSSAAPSLVFMAGLQSGV